MLSSAVNGEGVGRANFASWFDTDKITQIGWTRFMEETVSNGYDFVLYALFDLEPVKRFDCASDV